MPEQLDIVFGALADPTRRAILARLTKGDLTVAELAAPFQFSQPAISKQSATSGAPRAVASPRRATMTTTPTTAPSYR